MAPVRPAMTEKTMPDRTEAVFPGPFEREVRVSADRRTITHRAMAWYMDYTPAELVRWLGFYERMLARQDVSQYRADVEVLTKARNLLTREKVLP